MKAFLETLARLEKQKRLQYDPHDVRVEHYQSGFTETSTRVRLPHETDPKGAQAQWDQIRSELKPNGMDQLRIEPQDDDPKSAQIRLATNIYQKRGNPQAARENMRDVLERAGVLPRKVTWDKAEEKPDYKKDVTRWRN